jgi:hypothetical protein
VSADPFGIGAPSDPTSRSASRHWRDRTFIVGPADRLESAELLPGFQLPLTELFSVLDETAP